MFTSVLIWGMVIGLIHFVIVGVLYGNPFVDKIYQTAMANEPGVKGWKSRPKYLVTQFLGTQVEVYLLTIGFFWIRPLIDLPGIVGTLVLALFLAAVRVYPRFWNMWIQSTYPNRLLAIELINGTISSLVIIIGLSLLPTM